MVRYLCSVGCRVHIPSTFICQDEMPRFPTNGTWASGLFRIVNVSNSLPLISLVRPLEHWPAHLGEHPHGSELRPVPLRLQNPVCLRRNPHCQTRPPTAMAGPIRGE